VRAQQADLPFGGEALIQFQIALDPKLLAVQPRSAAAGQTHRGCLRLSEVDRLIEEATVQVERACKGGGFQV
jgi:hypothetical protein